MIYLLRTCCLQGPKIFSILSLTTTAPVSRNNTWMTECSDHTSWQQRALQILRTALYRQLSHQTALPMQQFSSLNKWQQITRPSAIQTFSLWFLPWALSGKENRWATNLQKHRSSVTIHQQHVGFTNKHSSSDTIVFHKVLFSRTGITSSSCALHWHKCM